MGGLSQGLSGGLGGAAAGSQIMPGWGTAIGGGLGLLGGLLGGGPRTTQNVPSDLAGARTGQIDLLQGLLGGGASGGGLQSFFGNLNIPASGLQQQSAGGISQYLNQPNPAQRALDTSMPALQEILTPGKMNPQFAQDLSLANQQGSRFGSGNEIMRGEAFRNLFNSRNQAAQTLGMLGQNANAANMGNLLQGYGVGQNQALQAAQGPNTYAQFLSGLLGLRQQMIGGLPISTTPGLGQQIGQAGYGFADILRLFSGGGQPGGNPASGLGGLMSYLGANVQTPNTQGIGTL